MTAILWAAHRWLETAPAHTLAELLFTALGIWAGWALYATAREWIGDYRHDR